jgi:hypothetical protein
MIVSNNPLVIRIVEGDTKEDVLDMLVLKELPFTDEEYLESFVSLLKDEKRKPQVIKCLKQIPSSVKSNYVAKKIANHRVAFYVISEALEQGNLQAISNAIHNQFLPYEFLIKIAEKGQIHMLENLLENQVKLIAYPEILDAIEKNPEASNYIKGKVNEIREYYLQPGISEEIPEDEVIDNIAELLLKEEKAKSEGEDLDDELLDQEIKEQALSELQAINEMVVAERVKLALTGTKTQRMILVKDANKMVSLAVIESPKISKEEVFTIIQDKSTPLEIINKITKKREWTRDYMINLELIKNPKTPVKTALGYIKKLHFRDLQIITRNKNISPVIRKLAQEHFKKRYKLK